MLLPLLSFFELTFFFFLLSNVAALSITVQSDTIVGQPSLVAWSREPGDGNGQLVFDFRFVKPDSDATDVGLALANVQVPPSTDFGTAQVVFPASGSYLLVAVTGPGYTKIGQSGQVNAFQVPTTSILTATTAQPTSSSSSATSSATPTSAPSSTSTTVSSGVRRKKNVGAIVGGTIGGVVFLAVLAALVILSLRRRQTTEFRRWTFHRDKMILPPVLDIRPISPIFSTPGDIDIERQQQQQQQQQQGSLPNDSSNPASPVVMIASPSGPRPLIKSSLTRPLPIPPGPLNPHQRDLAEQMEQLRDKMMELRKSPGPTQHIMMDDLQKQMVWLESQMKAFASST